VEEEKEQVEENLDEIETLKQEFLKLFKTLPNVEKKDFEKTLVKPEEFEKDNDANYHIDFMYSMGNCRASCYKLELMDWITVKLKAGRIVPALATTTAAVAGLQTLELVKVIHQCKKEDHRNIFLNLAVPIMQASEPGDVLKTKLVEGIEATLWDVWEIKDAKNMTLAKMIKKLEETYSGLEVRDIMKGNTPIFFHAILSAPGKEAEK